MSFLCQKYISFLLDKLIKIEVGLGYELHYSEPNYFKYHINQFMGNKGMENKLVKIKTIIILEVEDFKLIISKRSDLSSIINVKSKSTNDSEYVGTFTTKEVKCFTKEFSEVIIISLHT